MFSPKILVTIESVINYELKHLVQGLRDKKLSLIGTKTKLTIFRLFWKQLPRKPDVRLNNCKLKIHTYVKYLGIFINEVLSWNKQVDISYSKLSRANEILCKLRHFVQTKANLWVFFSFFYSHIFHSCLVWYYTKEINIDWVNNLHGNGNQKKSVFL